MRNLRRRLNKGIKGFTLVELLVVIAIIAILSVTAYVALGGQTGKARNSRRQQDLGAIQNALEIYFVENYSKYPDQLTDDSVPTNGPELEPKYMPKLPVDPTPKADGSDNAYVYQANSSKKNYQLAATMEQEDGSMKAYVIGNSNTDLISTGIQTSDCSSSCTVADESTTCVPYCL